MSSPLKNDKRAASRVSFRSEYQLSKQQITGQYGCFACRGIAPGDYRLAAGVESSLTPPLARWFCPGALVEITYLK